MKIRNFAVSLSLFLLLFLLSVENSYACVCVLQDSNSSLNQRVRDAYKNAAAVFAGRVVNIDYASNPTVNFVTIEVSDVWKGDIPPPTITIVTNKRAEACEFPFALYAHYLVYAVFEGNMLSTNICLRTNFLPNNPDIPILNKITKRTS